MKLDVIKLDGGKAGSVDLGEDVFGLDPRADILHRVVRWQPPCCGVGNACYATPNVTRAASQLRRSRLPHGLPRWLPAQWLPRMENLSFYAPRCVADVEEWRRSGARSAAGAAGAALCGGTRGSAAVVGALRAAAGSDDARGAVHCDDSGGAPAAQPAFPALCAIIDASVANRAASAVVLSRVS